MDSRFDLRDEFVRDGLDRRGYSTEFDVERYFRDAPLMIAGEGANEIQRTVIARQLADLGARVIKIERPGVGDLARDYDRTVHGQVALGYGTFLATDFALCLRMLPDPGSAGKDFAVLNIASTLPVASVLRVPAIGQEGQPRFAAMRRDLGCPYRTALHLAVFRSGKTTLARRAFSDKENSRLRRSLNDKATSLRVPAART